MKRSFWFISIILLFNGISAFAQENDYKPVRTGRQESPEPQEEQKEVQKKDSTSKTAENAKKWDWQRFRLGGNFGLSFGSQVYIEASPTFGYFVKPNKWQVGVGTKFIYFNNKNGYSYIDALGRTVFVPPYKSIWYGGSVFTNYIFWRGIYGHAEFELVNKESYFDFNKRVNVPHLLIGGGYMQPMGNAGNFYVSALFNVLDSDESIYTGTFGNFPLILRVGFGFGFGGRR